MDNPKIKKIIFTISVYNEQERIKDAILSIREFAKEIVLLDAGCTDNTLNEARKYFDVRNVKVTNDMFAVVERLESLENLFPYSISDEWVFPMNVSERLTPQLGSYLIELINKNNSIVGIAFYRQSFTLNKRTHNRKIIFVFKSLFGLIRVRLFKFGAWDRSKSAIHNEFPILKEYRFLLQWVYPWKKRELIHIRRGNVEDFERKHIEYSNQEASELYSRGVRGSVLSFFKLVFPSMIYFPWQFLISKEAGIVGIYHVIYKFQVWAKLVEYGTDKKNARNIF